MHGTFVIEDASCRQNSGALRAGGPGRSDQSERKQQVAAPPGDVAVLLRDLVLDPDLRAGDSFAQKNLVRKLA